MKITLYTTTNCQFSKQEKEYLTSHSLPFEEKNIDTNKQFLTDMMAIGNNFAGTPVTKIEKDDGTVAVLKGFTVEEFNTALGFAQPDATTTESKPAEPAVAPQPETTAPGMDSSAPAVETPPVTPTETPTPTVETPPAGTTPAQEPPLNDVLSQLETKINDTVKEAVNAPPAIPTVESPAPTATTPTGTTTPPPTDGAPAIPDFPADGTQPAK